ncbi:prenyltransferase/squalene oxidase repeat-containing protein [Streptomyces heilongjiangensis]|uniref:Prenyltransferase/squalene oxidase repeat-containing protein n=1 Tax=Streptomyces heilongjiangensis TaxID=945052 RepID=A0ABW1AYY4_9ACTN|nr:prenyltransferase/squalene oxidase repeat-containing protein [Streptomyces heilongjiangensis]MDC2951432.1 prenyltransferase/squalene oxidase repeat-containing protein [Streptomyces heilongjiangensis]
MPEPVAGIGTGPASLDQEDAYAPARDRLAHYLKTALDTRPPDAVQTAAASAALGRAVPDDLAARRALLALDHFAAARKRLMFTTVLAELGSTDGAPAPLEVFTGTGQQSRPRLESTTLKVMAAFLTGRERRITGEDWRALALDTRPGSPWEANHLARLLGLIALRRHPAHRAAVRDTLADVIAAQRPDGGLPFITGMDNFATVLGGLALRASGWPARLPHHMAGRLAASQNPDGGWGFRPGERQSDTDDTAYTLELLRATGPRCHSRAITAAERYLIGLRNDDGFRAFLRGAPAQAATTAAAVNALSPNRLTGSRPMKRSATSLRQREDGSFERSWSANGTPPGEARRTAAHAIPRAAIFLTSGQNPDGGWGHRPAIHARGSAPRTRSSP